MKMGISTSPTEGIPLPQWIPLNAKFSTLLKKKQTMDLCVKSCSTASAFSEVTEKLVSKNCIAISILNKHKYFWLRQ